MLHGGHDDHFHSDTPMSHPPIHVDQVYPRQGRYSRQTKTDDGAIAPERCD